MDAIIQPISKLAGKFTAPSSKSHTLRALWMAALAKDISTIYFPLQANDTQNTLNLMKDLGVHVQFENNQMIVDSRAGLKTQKNKIFSGDSGISTRFVLPMLGLRENHDDLIELDCSDQMRARPMQGLIDALNQLGMKINYRHSDFKLPISISGKLIGGKAKVTGITSQFISALLISLTHADEDSIISVESLNERPYLEMTLSWLKFCGMQFSHEKTGFFDTFSIQGRQRILGFSKRIAGDYSQSAAILIAIMLTHSEITVFGLDLQDVQGDKIILTLLEKLGAHIIWHEENVFTMSAPKSWQGFSIDANDTPDLVPVLAVLATQADTPSRIFNVPQARIKECDRLHAVTEALTQMGAQIKETQDSLDIQPSPLKGAVLPSFNDHRMVMALTIAGLIAKGETQIQQADCIEKTFPDFFQCMRQLGTDIQLI